MRDLTDNEVGGFGIADADDLLLVRDFIIVKQKVSPVTVSFDDGAVADFFEGQVELGRQPQQFARIWIHTHPDMSPAPSGVDEETFKRVFGTCDWAVMAIVSSNDDTYARLRFNTGPGGAIKIPVEVDYSEEFEGSNFPLWDKQFFDNVEEEVLLSVRKRKTSKKPDKQEVFGSSEYESSFMTEDIFDELGQMDPAERQEFMEELAYHSKFWDEYDKEVYDG